MSTVLQGVLLTFCLPTGLTGALISGLSSKVLLTLAQGVATYSLPVDTVDLLEHVIRTGAGNSATQADLTISRISVSTYATIPT
jgi:hypothetical protein